MESKFNRQELAKLFAEKGFTKGVEVGVLTGEYSRILCKENPKLELKSIDPYRELYCEPNTKEWGSRLLDELFESATNLLAPYNCEIIRKTSLEAVVDFPYESIDFVYIDGSHYFDYVMVDIIEWGKRVRKGGIISGHDYCSSWSDIMRAVNSYTEVHKATLRLTQDTSPSWWIKKKW